MVAQKFSVTAARDNASVVENKDRVALTQGGKSLRNDDLCLRAQSVEMGEKCVLGFMIEGAGAVVKHEDVWLQRENARDGQALLLSAGEIVAAL